ncbi:myocardial zonula adherens protein-like isoform X1 [Lynx canadensis]|uniref:myocardial zonula adherens protein-like isoform X1 n=1 Tax=Lynx canadensis TaxID=61383 RepID=UPI0013C427DE|nr:myocardial zonula adherens protein-like isoform X1 [Lynx canadensis]
MKELRNSDCLEITLLCFIISAQMEKYANRVHTLTEERETLSHGCEKENKQFRHEVKVLQPKQEVQIKEVEEMLYQEGLSEIALSSPSEQIAYLLVERSTLLQKLEARGPKPESQRCMTSKFLKEHPQENFEQNHQPLRREQEKHQEHVQQSKKNVRESHNEDLEKDKTSQNCLERNAEQVAERLRMAQEEIRRLTDELQGKEKEQSKLDSALKKAQLEIEHLKENLIKLKENDSTDLQRAKERNQRLDEEILALRNRVRSLDSEKKVLGEVVERLKGKIHESQENKQLGNHSPGKTVGAEQREQGLCKCSQVKMRSLGWTLIQYDRRTCEKRKCYVKTETHRECHVMTDGEIGGMHVQAKTCQGLTATTRS